MLAISDDASSEAEGIGLLKINQGAKFGTLKEPMFIV